MSDIADPLGAACVERRLRAGVLLEVGSLLGQWFRLLSWYIGRGWQGRRRVEQRCPEFVVRLLDPHALGVPLLPLQALIAASELAARVAVPDILRTLACSRRSNDAPNLLSSSLTHTPWAFHYLFRQRLQRANLPYASPYQTYSGRLHVAGGLAKFLDSFGRRGTRFTARAPWAI